MAAGSDPQLARWVAMAEEQDKYIAALGQYKLNAAQAAVVDATAQELLAKAQVFQTIADELQRAVTVHGILAN